MSASRFGFTCGGTRGGRTKRGDNETKNKTAKYGVHLERRLGLLFGPVSPTYVCVLCNIKVVGAITCTYMIFVCVGFSMRVKWLDCRKIIGQVLAVVESNIFGSLVWRTSEHNSLFLSSAAYKVFRKAI